MAGHYEALIALDQLEPVLARQIAACLASASDRELIAEYLLVAMLRASGDVEIIDMETGRSLPVPRGHTEALRRRLAELDDRLTVRQRLALAGIVSRLEGLLAGSSGIEIVPFPERESGDRP